MSPIAVGTCSADPGGRIVQCRILVADVFDRDGCICSGIAASFYPDFPRGLA